MKITWTSLKGVCLLLLGLATVGGGRSFAADTDTLNFAALADSSSATNMGKAASPFKDESASTPANAAPGAAAAPSAAATPKGPAEPGIVASDEDSFAGAPGRVWFRGEYLILWTNGAHLPPMVSTYTGGAVGATVFGDDVIRSGTHEGYQIDTGMWLDGEHCWGLEANYFDVTGRPDNYDSGQTTGSTFPLVRAFYDPTIPGVVPGFVAVPGIAAGRITVDTNDYFQSAGIWLRHQLQASEWSTNDSDVNWTDSSARTFRLDAIGGYRFARLIDSVNEQDSEFDPSLNQYTNINNYRTVNDFNGLELGLDAVYTFSHWSLDVVGKAAVGFNNQNVSLYYLTELDTTNSGGGPLPPSTASPEISRNCFSVIPQLELNLGYQVTDHLKVTGGYDLLYWTNVVRAASQIPVGPGTPAYPIGSATVFSPVPPTGNMTTFRAEGLHLGAELRF